MNVLLSIVFLFAVVNSTALLEEFLADLKNPENPERVEELYNALTKNGEESFIGPDNFKYVGDLWLAERNEGFIEAFSMSSKARTEYKELGKELKTDRNSFSMIARVESMIKLIKSEKLNPGVAKYIQSGAKVSRLTEVFEKKTMKDRIILMVPAAQAFLDALYALGGGSWGSWRSKFENCDKVRSECIRQFAGQISTDLKFSRPSVPFLSSYVDDLRVLSLWMFELLYENGNPCNKAKTMLAPESWCVFSKHRLGELRDELQQFEILSGLLIDPSILTPMSEDTYKGLSAILARMKAKTKEIDFEKYVPKFKMPNFKDALEDWWLDFKYGSDPIDTRRS